MTLIGASNISQPYLSTKGINNFAVSHLNKDMEKLKITLLVIVIRINPGLTSLFGIHVRKLQLWTDGRDKSHGESLRPGYPFFQPLYQLLVCKKTPVGPVKS